MRREILTNNRIRFIFIALAVILFLDNGFAGPPDAMNRTRIKPTLVSLGAGEEQQFYAVKESSRLTAAFATNKVTWYVNGSLGGNNSVGYITKDGIYQAPEKSPGSPEIHVSAMVNTSSNKILWATVLFDGEPPKYQSVKEWGEWTDSLKHLKDPSAIVLEQDGNILIADGKIKRFSADGEFMMEMGESRGDYEGSLVDPINLALDSEGNIFVSDKRTGPPRIQAFSPDGKYLYGFAPKGTSENRVMDTRGMAFNSKEQLYIGDIDNIRVSVFEHSGAYVQNIGKKGAYPGKLNVPYGLTIDANDDLFIASYFGPCQKFTPDGHFLFAFSYANPPEGPVYFTDIASDRWGNVYVIVKGAQNPNGEYDVIKDARGNRVEIMKYNNNGDFIANIQLHQAGRDAQRLVVDEYGSIHVLFKGKDKIGVEVLEKQNESQASRDVLGKNLPYSTLWQWSESIENPEYFIEPHSIHLDADGNVLIADMNASRVMRFSRKGTFLSELGEGAGSENAFFNKPRDVAINTLGNYVVTDQKSGKHRVQVFDAEGNFVRSFGEEGAGPGNIDWPHGLAFDSENNVYVTDVANRRVNQYGANGEYIKALGQSGPNVGKLTMPHGLTITPNDAVFISDYFGTVQKFSTDGKYLLAFKNDDVHTKGAAFIHTICSDHQGYVYVMVRGIVGFEGSYEESPVEERSFYIGKYSNDGEYIGTILLPDSGREVIHATVDAQGIIYALFKGNGSMGVEVLGRGSD